MARTSPSTTVAVALAAALLAPLPAPAQQAGVPTLVPGRMEPVGTVDERYQSFNVEMLEVTGGKFWKPYAAIGKGPGTGAVSDQGGDGAPAGMSADLYRDRPPLDLSNARLRKLASALAPAYVRVSGTWANTTFFADADDAPRTPPKGYGGVLTRQQWLGVIDFSRAIGAPIVTSLPNGEGTRDAQGVWKPDQARTWLTFTRAHGGVMAAAEYFNEPTLAAMGGAPKGYDAAAYGRDWKAFDTFMRGEFPSVKLLAPGSVGEADAGWAVAGGGYGNIPVLHAADLAVATGDADFFSYHHYGAASERCAAMGHQTSEDQALSEDWLGRTDATLAYYRGVRDRAMPGKAFWNTETADAACGGNPWGGRFVDSFRYLDQLGRLARQDVKVVFHNTLDASDYGLLDENTFAPKPDYWAALLWRRTMGTTVLDPGMGNGPGLHVYAHCMRQAPGGVTLLVLNTDRTRSRSLDLPVAGDRLTLTAATPAATAVLLNGRPLRLGTDDAVPDLTGLPVPAGQAEFAPVSVTFVTLPSANNAACR